MKKTIIACLCAISLITFRTEAQTRNNVGINYTGAAADTNALLDVSATNKGTLITRVALTSTTSNAPIGSTIPTSLLVYNTATANDVVPGYYYWNGSAWVKLTANNVSTPATCSQGDLMYASGTNTYTVLPKSTTSSSFLKNSGTNNNPAWAQPAVTDLSDYTPGTDWSGSVGFTGFSSNPTVTTARYGIIGKMAWIFLDLSAGTSNSSSFTVTGLPVTPNVNARQACVAIDNGTQQSTSGMASVTAGSTTITFGKSWGEDKYIS